MTLFRSGIIVAFFTLVSRIFGLIRELCFAALFGATDIADGVYVAFKLPNLFRRIFAEGALSNVFVPMYNKKLLVSKSSASYFSGEVFTLLLFTLIMLALLMQIFMPQLMFIIAPGFYGNEEKFRLTVLLCRITMPYLIFVSIVALFGAILNSVKRFSAFAFVPSILSISVIAFALVFDSNAAPAVPISASLIVAGILQVLFMFLCIKKAKLIFPLVLKPTDRDVKKFLSNMGPAAISSGVQQLNLFVSQSIASFIEGTISILSYADRIYQFPLSIIGTSFATILLPELSKIYKTDDITEAIRVQNNAIKVGLLFSLPATFGIIALSHPIIHLIYERGMFTAQNTTATSEAISAFSLGLPAFILAKILTPIFYANDDTKTPMKITILTLVFNTAINLILMHPLKHIGIALGTSVAAWYNLLLLYSYSKKQNKFSINPDVVAFCFKVLISCIMMLIIVKLLEAKYSEYFYSEYLLIKIFTLGGTITVGAIIFFIMAYLLKLHSFKNVT